MSFDDDDFQREQALAQQRRLFEIEEARRLEDEERLRAQLEEDQARRGSLPPAYL
jgi:hypothetical protein